MNVFIFYSRADNDWAVKLRADLQREFISAWLKPDLDVPVVEGRFTLQQAILSMEKLEKAIQATDAIIVMVSSDSESDSRQRHVLRMALEAVWSDPNKRMIPFLLNDAETPAFVRSSVSPEESLPIVRAREPERDWQQAVKNLVAILRNEADWSQVEQIPSVTEQDREEQRRRREEIIQYVETLKANMPLGETAAEGHSARTQP